MTLCGLPVLILIASMRWANTRHNKKPPGWIPGGFCVEGITCLSAVSTGDDRNGDTGAWPAVQCGLALWALTMCASIDVISYVHTMAVT